jgi:hypoxanthine phosphoribosyltransferase
MRFGIVRGYLAPNRYALDDSNFNCAAIDRGKSDCWKPIRYLRDFRELFCRPSHCTLSFRIACARVTAPERRYSPVGSHDQEHLKILLRSSAIQKRVREMGRQISKDYKGQRVHLIGVLKGAAIFLSDLIRQIRIEVSLDFMALSSYGHGSQTSGQVRLIKDLDTSIEGLNVIVVEDILDTGLTLGYLLRVLRQRKPKTLRIAALLDKPHRRIKKEVKADYIGFRIPNEFVVGYGLDYAERYRNLKDVYVLSLPPN